MRPELGEGGERRLVKKNSLQAKIDRFTIGDGDRLTKESIFTIQNLMLT